MKQLDLNKVGAQDFGIELKNFFYVVNKINAKETFS